MMKSIATLLAFLFVGLPAHAEKIDCRSLPDDRHQCDDGTVFRRHPDNEIIIFSDTDLFHLLPDGTVEMIGFGRPPAGTFRIERKDPVSQPAPDDVRR
jgi:hypothetical protein